MALKVVSMEELKLTTGSRGRASTATGAGTWRRASPGSSLAPAVRAPHRGRSSLRWRRGSSSFADDTRAGARVASTPSSDGRRSSRRRWRRSTARSGATTWSPAACAATESAPFLRPPGPHRLGQRGPAHAARARRRLAELFPTSRHVEIADSYTLIPDDQPALLASHLRQFIADTTDSGELLATRGRGS
jgi:hypothetical protein